jgi:hypothetical protein
MGLGLALASGADGFVYWGGTINAIGRANLDGSGVEPSFIVPQTNTAQAIYYRVGRVAVDPQHVYWTAGIENAGPNEFVIGRSSLDGSGIEPSFIKTAGIPTGIAVNAEHLYWVNEAKPGGTSTISRANANGTEVNEDFMTGLPHPCGDIALDSGHIYWATGGKTIARAKLNGTQVEESFITVNASAGTCGVAVDGGHIYWDEGPLWVGRANVNGTEVEESWISGLNSVCEGIAVDNTHVYWATIGGVARAKLDGTEVNQNFINPISQYGALICNLAVDPLLPTTTTIGLTPTTITYGEGVMLTATVANAPSTNPLTPTGTVQFRGKTENSFSKPEDLGGPLTLNANGQALYFPTELINVGETVNVEYSGNGQLGASTSANAQLTVQPAATSLTLNSSANPQTAHQPVTITATVQNLSTSVTPEGAVEFLVDGEPVLELVPVEENGQAGIIAENGLPAGDHTVQAKFLGNPLIGRIPDFKPSEASLIQHIVNPAPPAKAAGPPTAPPAFQASLSVFPLGTTIRGFVKHGLSDSVELNAPGTVTEDLYAENGTLPATAAIARHKHGKHHRTALLLAKGSTSTATTATVTVRLTPTSAGIKFLKKARHAVRAVLLTTVEDAKTGNVTNLPHKTVTLKGPG